jgi:hypothetical protein
LRGVGGLGGQIGGQRPLISSEGGLGRSDVGRQVRRIEIRDHLTCRDSLTNLDVNAGDGPGDRKGCAGVLDVGNGPGRRGGLVHRSDRGYRGSVGSSLGAAVGVGDAAADRQQRTDGNQGNRCSAPLLTTFSGHHGQPDQLSHWWSPVRCWCRPGGRSGFRSPPHQSHRPRNRWCTLPRSPG